MIEKEKFFNLLHLAIKSRIIEYVCINDHHFLKKESDKIKQCEICNSTDLDKITFIV